MELSSFDSIRTLLGTQGTQGTTGSRIIHSQHDSESNYLNLLSAVRKEPEVMSDDENEIRTTYDMNPGAGVSMIFYFVEFKRKNHLKYSWRMIKQFERQIIEKSKEIEPVTQDKPDNHDAITGILCTLSNIFNKTSYDAWIQIRMAGVRNSKEEMKVSINKLVAIFKLNKHKKFGDIWMYAWKKRCFEFRFNMIMYQFTLDFDQRFEALKKKGFEVWKIWSLKQSAKHKLKARLHLLKFRSFQNRKLFTVVKCMETNAKLQLVQTFLKWREQATRLTNLRKKELHQNYIDNTIHDHSIKIESLTNRLKNHEIQITKEKIEAEILNMMIELLDGVHII